MNIYDVQGFYNKQKRIEGFTNSYSNPRVIEGLDETSLQTKKNYWIFDDASSK